MTKNLIRFIKDPTLEKLFARNASLFIVLFFNHYAMQEIYKRYGFQITTLTISKNDFEESYWQRKELPKVRKIIRRRLNQSKSINDYYEKDALPIFKEYLDLSKNLWRKYSGKKEWGWQELGLDYQFLTNFHCKTQALLWFIFFTDIVLDGYLKEVTDKYSKKGYELDKNFLITISTPLKKSAVILERIALLKLAIKKGRGKKVEKDLYKHWEKWRWFPCYNPTDRPYDLDYFVKELKELKLGQAKSELKNILLNHKEHKHKYKNIVNRIKSKEFVRVIKLVNDLAFYRERRNDVRREGLSGMRPFFAAMGKRLGIAVEDVGYLTKEETVKSLKNKALAISKQELAKRRKRYLLLANKDFFYLTINPAELKTSEKEIANKLKTCLDLRGVVASQGKVVARAFVIDNIEKLQKFRAGTVLIASMTAPDYIQAMRKASAIVTDEGGITSHAAIVARELKKPCIVGTKIATKVFKDGDLVEVDANKGIVRKI